MSNTPSLEPQDRPPLEPIYIYLVIGLAAFFISDLVTTHLRGYMLPTQAPPARIQKGQFLASKSRNEYNTITGRNPFNSDGIIPPPLSQEGEEPVDDSVPVPSQLPLTLVGTIVHANPKRSVATIQNRSRSQNEQFQAYRVDDEVPGMARILDVDRKRVVFRNINNGRKEYIEIKDDALIKIGIKEKGSEPKEEVQKEGNRFVLKRSDVMKHIGNLPELLQQARAVPNIIPGSGGQVDGFRLLEMEKGSIFEQLGLKRMDIIKGANGEPINSPAKAMEMFNQLKSSNRIDIQVERNGQSETLNYIIE